MTMGSMAALAAASSKKYDLSPRRTKGASVSAPQAATRSPVSLRCLASCACRYRQGASQSRSRIPTALRVRSSIDSGNHSPNVPERWPDPHTFAAGIRVPKALGDFIVLKALRESSGIAVAVSETEIERAMGAAGRAEGMLVCPEGGAAIAATSKLRRGGWIRENEEVVIFNTGTGLKYAEFLQGEDPRHLAADELPDG